MPLNVPLEEHAESRSPGNVGFGFDGARGMMNFWADNDKMLQTILAVVGDVDRRGDGMLARRLPICHPEYPWLRADRLANVVGVGVPEPTDSDTQKAADNAPDAYGDYPQRLLTVEFSGKNYTLIPDNFLNANPVRDSWIDGDGNRQNTIACTEWMRYVSWDYQPASELITASQGQTYLAVDASPIRSYTFGGVGVTRTQGPPHGYQFTGQPKMWWKKTAITATWWWVPASYVTSPNSYLTQCLMCVNLYPIWGYGPGQLLYLGSKPRFYTPPLPRKLNLDEATIFSIEQVCVIEMSFMATRILPGPGVSMRGAGSPNAVWGGFNLAPTFSTRRFYPVFTPNPSNPNDATQWVPPHDAVPFQLLFCDPDVR